MRKRKRSLSSNQTYNFGTQIIEKPCHSNKENDSSNGDTKHTKQKVHMIKTAGVVVEGRETCSNHTKHDTNEDSDLFEPGLYTKKLERCKQYNHHEVQEEGKLHYKKSKRLNDTRDKSWSKSEQSYTVDTNDEKEAKRRNRLRQFDYNEDERRREASWESSETENDEVGMSNHERNRLLDNIDEETKCEKLGGYSKNDNVLKTKQKQFYHYCHTNNNKNESKRVENESKRMENSHRLEEAVDKFGTMKETCGLSRGGKVKESKSKRLKDSQIQSSTTSTYDDMCPTCDDVCPTCDDVCPTCDDVCPTCDDGCPTCDDGCPTCDDGFPTCDDGCPTCDDVCPTCDGLCPTCDGLCPTCDGLCPTCDGLCPTCDGLCPTYDGKRSKRKCNDVSRSESSVPNEVKRSNKRRYCKRGSNYSLDDEPFTVSCEEVTADECKTRQRKRRKRRCKEDTSGSCGCGRNTKRRDHRPRSRKYDINHDIENDEIEQAEIRLMRRNECGDCYVKQKNSSGSCNRTCSNDGDLKAARMRRKRRQEGEYCCENAVARRRRRLQEDVDNDMIIFILDE